VPKAKVAGVVEKGPFSAGTQVVLRELDDELQQTGRSFSTMTEGDTGGFSFGELEIEPIVELEADGFFFNEVYPLPGLSDSRIVLTALADVRQAGSVNVNVLTHLTRKRIRVLVEGGDAFATAKARAERETLAAFCLDGVLDGASGDDDGGIADAARFEGLSIAREGELSAVLLAVSMIVMPDGNFLVAARLDERLNDLATDLEADGDVDDAALLEQFAEQIRVVNPRGVVERLSDYYDERGRDAEVPDPAAMVTRFLACHDREPVDDYCDRLSAYDLEGAGGGPMMEGCQYRFYECASGEDFIVRCRDTACECVRDGEVVRQFTARASCDVWESADNPYSAPVERGSEYVGAVVAHEECGFTIAIGATWAP
jgi:hypothetical protein